MTSTKPYLLRAIHEWAQDNNFTPQVLVNTSIEGVIVPESHIVDGQIVLNVSLSAVKMDIMDNDCLSFSARFSGTEYSIYLPMESIVAIYARENSQGIFFEEQGSENPDPDGSTKPVIVETSSGGSAEKAPAAKRSTSHLKVIK